MVAVEGLSAVKGGVTFYVTTTWGRFWHVWCEARQEPICGVVAGEPVGGRLPQRLCVKCGWWVPVGAAGR